MSNANQRNRDKIKRELNAKIRRSLREARKRLKKQARSPQSELFPLDQIQQDETYIAIHESDEKE